MAQRMEMPAWQAAELLAKERAETDGTELYIDRVTYRGNVAHRDDPPFGDPDIARFEIFLA